MGEERAHLEPRSMQVLEALCERPGEVCAKQELIDAVWGDAYVSDEVLTHAIWDVRRAFGDDASNPTFIQTIPKKGYRLIAAVEPLESDGRGGRARTAPLGRSAVLWALVLVGLLILAALLMDRGAGPLPAEEGPTLVLLPPRAAEGSEVAARQLGSHLADRLRDEPGFELQEREACQSEDLGDTYCLETATSSSAEGVEVVARLVTAPSRGVVYAMPPIGAAGAGGLFTVAEQISEAATTYFEVVESPDFKPWISFDRHDIEAIRSFLLGARYVYRHEVGGADSMAAAIAADPRFVAPRVWRTPAIAAQGDPEAVAAHRRALRELFAGGTEFEKVMISWAIAMLDGSVAEQLRHLRVALELEPANRPARLVLAGTLMSQGSLEEAWPHFAGLLEQGWDFPGLYPAGGMCALLLGRIDDARGALEESLEAEPVDPASLALLELLAVYDDDPVKRGEQAAKLDRRKKEMAPEVFALDLAPFVGVLAEAAAAEGRSETAERLRESLD